MSTLSICIIVAFCVGYLFIALESVTKVNKAAVALLMFVACWTLLMFSPESYFPNLAGQDLVNEVSSAIEHHLGSTSTTLFSYCIRFPISILSFFCSSFSIAS